MATPERRLRIRHSAPRRLPAGAKRGAAIAGSSKRAEVTIVVRSRGTAAEWRKLVEERTTGTPGQRRYLTRSEFARSWGASPQDLAAVKKFANAHGLKVISTDAFRRCVVVSGTLRQLSRALAVDFFAVQYLAGTFRSYRGAPTVPAPLHEIIEHILGLDDLPSAKRHVIGIPRPGAPEMDRKELLRAYDIPRHLRGKGQCVAIIELAGGFHRRDCNQFCSGLDLPRPRIHARTVAGAKNAPAPAAQIRRYVDALRTAHMKPCAPTSITGDPAVDASVEWTIETTMDISMVSVIAPEASILLVQTTNTDQGQYHAVTSVIADRKHAPSVLSCSWGASESAQTKALMRSLDWWFQAAAVMGITVCVSSGDDGDGTMCAPPGRENLTVSFPASNPHVLAVGGTTLETKTQEEIAWAQTLSFGPQMAGGGGFSREFALPSWQQRASIDPARWLAKGVSSGTGRAIPDVAAKADLDQAFCVIAGGVDVASGGTSAATPLWAALIALLNEGLSANVGSLHTLLYDGTLLPAIRDVVRGSTGHFRARKGWDPCTGWGTPMGEKLLQLLR